jgi:NTE family protein
MEAARPQRADLVLAGGGVKGIAHVGVLSVLHERGYRFERAAGTSAGAIVAALVAAGMSPRRMHEILGRLDYRAFRDRSGRDKIPFLGPGLSLALEDGIFEGEYLREWLGAELSALGVETFGDLRRDDPDSSLPPDQRFGLVVMAADITRGELVRLPWDYRDRYGLDPDRQPVVDAVRASMSIPFFFEPVRLAAADGNVSTLVDGGVLTNFPIGAFDRTDGRAPRWPTFGITLIPPLPVSNAKLFPGLGLMRRGPLHLLECLLTTMMVGHDQAQLRKPWVAARSIPVDTEQVNVVDFDIEPDAQMALYAGGRAAAERFLATWDWEGYLRRYRGASDPDETHVDVGELGEAAAVEHVRRDLDDEALGRAPDRHPADDQDSLR